MARSMQHQAPLLRGCFGRYKPLFGRLTASQIASASVLSFFCRLSRVEERRGGARSSALRFLSPLIKPDVQFSRIRLSDRLHHEAHVGDTLRTRFSTSTPGFP